MKLKASIITTLLISCFISFSCAQSQTEKADNLFYAHQQEQGPGLAIRVSKAGKLLYKNQVGIANLEHQVFISDSTRFLVGSISKQFTAYAILMLEQRGKLSIDDPVVKYLPELTELNKTVTLRMLANHTSGFRNTYDLNGLRGKSDEDLTRQDEMVNLLLRQKGLNFLPGDRFQYNNAGYVLLAEVVERVSGILFSEFVEQNIFEPLNMRNSLFLEKPNMVIKNLADSYIKTADAYRYIPMNRSIVGSTGLYTTTEDLIKWTENFEYPVIDSLNIFNKMILPSKLNSGENIPYGLGLETKTYRGLKVVFHGGGDAGYRAYLLYIPEYKFSVVVAGNYEAFNPLDIAYGMIDIFLEEQLSSKPKPTAPDLSISEIEKYTGTYQVFPGLYLEITAKDDSLFMSSFAQPEDKLYLPALTDNTFKFRPQQHSKIVFANNQLIWHFSDFYYPARKVNLHPPTLAQINIDDYLGVFYNDELQTTYTFLKKNNKIIVTHPLNGDIELIPIDKDIFISNSGIVSRLEFIRDEQNKITTCKMSSQTAYDLKFKKQCR